MPTMKGPDFGDVLKISFHPFLPYIRGLLHTT
jgi:hypothetical protein